MPTAAIEIVIVRMQMSFFKVQLCKFELAKLKGLCPLDIIQTHKSLAFKTKQVQKIKMTSDSKSLPD